MNNLQNTQNLKDELLFLLNSWDPIGVWPLKGGPKDEYECLIDPLIKLLSEGGKADELINFLEKELSEHMGLNPAHSKPREFTKKLLNWWKRK